MKITKSFSIYSKIIIFIGWLFFISCQSQGQNKTQLTMKNPYYSHTDILSLNVSKQEWKSILDPEVYQIAFEKGTERAFTGQYWDYEGRGTYYCAVCGQTLFRADAKFASS